jgi:HEAT repeat protein
MTISSKTRKLLWGRSGNRCALCQRLLYEEESEIDVAVILGEECHIVAKNNKGPRGNSEKPREELDSYENLIILCPTHHELVDKQFKKYTTSYLGDMKKSHEAWVEETLSRRDKNRPSPKINNILLYLRNIIYEFEHLSLSPIENRKLPVDILAPMKLIEAFAENEKTLPQRYNPKTVIENHTRVLIVGAGGSGKTTILRWLAFKNAMQCLETFGLRLHKEDNEKNLLPIYVELSRYNGDLLDQIHNSINFGGLALDKDNLIGFLNQNSTLLLFDGFDEIKGRKSLYEDIQNLIRLAPHTRMVITSRPTDVVTNLTSPHTSLSFIPFNIAPLDDNQLGMILKIHLGSNKSVEFMRLLEFRCLLEVFRQPLMAWLGARAYLKSRQMPVPLEKSALYKFVISELLSEWESKRHPDLIDYHMELKISCLARIGYEMILNEIPMLDKLRAVTICQEILNKNNYDSNTKTTSQLLDDLYSMCIIKRSFQEISFWHTSLRDYFAGLYLARNYRIVAVIRFSFQLQWHEAIIFLVGLIPELKARDLLKWLVKLAWINIQILRITPDSWATRQLFFLLRCLNSTTTKSHDSLKDKLIEKLGCYDLYITGTTTALEPTFFLGPEGSMAHFQILIAQLGTKKSLEYIQNKSRRYSIFGIAQFRNAEALKILINGYKDPWDEDSLADRFTGQLLLDFSPNLLVPSLSDGIKLLENNERCRLVNGINSALATIRQSSDKDLKRLLQDRSWLLFFTTLALHDPDKKIRSTATSILSNSSNCQYRLPDLAEKKFLDALKDENENVRFNAIWPLLKSDSKKSLIALRHALNDTCLHVRLLALNALEYRDRRRFPEYVLTVLRQYLTTDCANEIDYKLLLNSINFDQSHSGLEGEKLEEVRMLILGAHLWHSFLRSASVISLGDLGFGFTAPYLINLLNQDESEAVRANAVTSLYQILGNKSEPYIHNALRDSSSNVRIRAVCTYENYTKDIFSKALPDIQKLMQEDPDEAVRHYAKYALKHYGVDDSPIGNISVNKKGDILK